MNETVFDVSLDARSQYLSNGIPCRRKVVYKRKCKSECRQLGKQRKLSKAVSAVLYNYGEVVQDNYSPSGYKCMIYGNPNPKRRKEYLEAETDCSR